MGVVPVSAPPPPPPQPQYVFIHTAINEAIMCGDTSVKAPELKEWLSKLEPDPETGKNLMESQFEVRVT